MKANAKYGFLWNMIANVLIKFNIKNRLSNYIVFGASFSQKEALKVYSIKRDLFPVFMDAGSYFNYEKA